MPHDPGGAQQFRHGSQRLMDRHQPYREVRTREAHLEIPAPKAVRIKFRLTREIESIACQMIFADRGRDDGGDFATIEELDGILQSRDRRPRACLIRAAWDRPWAASDDLVVKPRVQLATCQSSPRNLWADAGGIPERDADDGPLHWEKAADGPLMLRIITDAAEENDIFGRENV